MAERSSRLQILSALAREPSAEKRHSFLADLARIFRAARTHNPRDIQDYGEMLTRVLPQLPEGDRRFFSEAVAAAEEAPSYLIRQIAMDVPGVAAPVLTQSSLLSDDDLIEAMKKGSSARLAAIAARARLSPKIIAILAQVGDPATTQALLANLAIKMPESVFAPLVMRARKDPVLSDLLIARADIPSEYLASLFFTLGSEKRFALSHALAKLAPAGAAVPPAAPIAEDALLQAIRAGNRPAFETALEAHFALPNSVAQKIARDPSCEAMATAALGLGLSRALFSTYALLTRPETADGSTRSTAILSLYERFSPLGARIIVAGWSKEIVRRALPAPGPQRSESMAEGLPPPPPASDEGARKPPAHKTVRTASAGVPARRSSPR